MKSIGTRILMLSLLVASLFSPACKKPTAPTLTRSPYQVHMKIIPFQDAPAIVDSNSCYIKMFFNWNSISGPDTAKADSLAQWFAQSSYLIDDIWFPDVDTRCLSPINTQNTVSLRLSSRDTTLRAQGFVPTTTVVNGCYPYYRHYTFTIITSGL